MTGSARLSFPVVGYCASCQYLRRWAIERPVIGRDRYGRCLADVTLVAPRMMCDRYVAAGPTGELDRIGSGVDAESA